MDVQSTGVTQSVCSEGLDTLMMKIYLRVKAVDIIT